ncbi:hypothetical protein EIP86_002623 [Pleurotus ostreatoroseus]|nr:hypothetical protein EIP86_002623 [Pleurotus ostreatoroseus]
MSDRRFATYFDVDILGSQGLVPSISSASSPLNSNSNMNMSGARTRTRSRERSSTQGHPRPAPPVKRRQPPARQCSYDSYMGPSRTPSGELYRNQAFATSLHRPSSPVGMEFPKSSISATSYVSSPLSRTSSETDRTTPPTTPEPSEEAVYVDPDERTDKHPDVQAVADLRSNTAMSLWNDYHATELLIRLAGNVPTFHPFDIPPQRVLDLGCGEGTWVRYAAAKWNSPDTHIDGLDIQPLWQSGRRLAGPNTLTARVTWKLANFFNRLPYEDNTFDLVRMANLSLSVPRNRWLSLLQEVRRVLRVGGHLELVEDEFIFPPIQHASVMHAAQEQSQSSGLIPSESETERFSRFRELEESKRITEYLESAFGHMLANKYSISDPHAMHVWDALSRAFGTKHVQEPYNQHIAIPHRPPEVTRSNEGFKTPRKISLSSSQGPRMHVSDHRGSEPALPTSAAPKAVQVLSTGRPRRSGDLPPVLSSKAAKILGNATTASSSRPYQPTGFIVLPDKFFDCRPDVLEMYACKNMHVVMSCRKALHAYFLEHKDTLTDLGNELTDEEFERMFDDAMWEYDRHVSFIYLSPPKVDNYHSFKRRRLNWPQDYPGLLMRMEDDDSEASSSKNIFNLSEGRRRAQSTSCTFVSRASAEHCTQARVIRIFGATKANELR